MHSQPSSRSRRLRQRLQYLVALVAAVLLLGLIGSIMGPAWQPEELQRQLTVASPDPRIVTPTGAHAPSSYQVSTSDLTVELPGGSITARLTAPVGAPDGAPGILLLHGAGTAGHNNFADQAHALAAAGVYVLVPDKGLDTYDTRDRDYVGMARDYLRSWELLADVDGVNPAAVSVYGESEGAWIAPIMAVLEPDIASLVLISAPVVPPREQFAFAMDNYLHNTGVPEPVFRVIPRALGADIPGGGFSYADFDVSVWQRQLIQPVLMVYGTADTSMPLVQGPQQLIEDIATAGNHSYQVRYFADANHGIRVDGDLAAGFTESLTAWIHGLPEVADQSPRIAGDQPTQHYRADAVPSPRWFANGNALVLTSALPVLLVLAAAGIWVVPALTRRRRPTRFAAPMGRATCATMVAPVAALTVFAAYCLSVADLALNYRTNAWIVTGGWVAVEVAALAATAVLIYSIGLGVQHMGSIRPLGKLVWWLAHVGSFGLLVQAAYWGVFPVIA
ncbi:MAG: alpha/beta hydrolase family protein [Beutenbergiaceae bacterium]